VWESESDADRVWERYFGLVAEAARCGLFDILGHPDLVKMWGPERPWPQRDLRFYYAPAVEAIGDAGVAVELSTAGLRKPIGEMYPAPELARMCAEARAPFALSSDAHAPEQVGYEYGRATEMLRELGVGEICVFERRERRLEPLG
jgi:histidinol-phosphatase (PHP family)